MQLSDAAPGDVVRNVGNDSFYRYERPSEDRARIRPLELFPNGLLVAKPTDTIVAADLEVEVIGQWSDGLVVKGGKGKSRLVYEREQERLLAQLGVLEAEAITIPPKRRGSYANRVKAVRTRLDALHRGLEDLGTEPIEIDLHRISLPAFKLRQPVIMPSGQLAQFLGLLPVGQHLLATVACRIGDHTGMLQVDPAALRPAEQRYMATI